MNRLIVGGILALVTGTSGLMAQKQPTPKSQKEVEALQAMFNAQDPDTRIKAAEDLLTKFADTQNMWYLPPKKTTAGVSLPP